MDFPPPFSPGLRVRTKRQTRDNFPVLVYKAAPGWISLVNSGELQDSNNGSLQVRRLSRYNDGCWLPWIPQ
jgi:hypothetical protein